MKIMICTLKSWNVDAAKKFKNKYDKEYDIFILSDPEKLVQSVNAFKPNYIFFPHWSNIIPKEVYSKYVCIVFHMTDLPYGRGGSPLQNLIVQGKKETKISAIAVTEEIDAGQIYMKADLNLNGTAEEIFIRASKIIFEQMMPQIIQRQMIPQEQTGEVVRFKRRNPKQSELQAEMSLETIFDYIRMLDGEGYPKAYIEFGRYKLEFSRASLKNGKIIADVEIIEEKKNE